MDELIKIIRADSGDDLFGQLLEVKENRDIRVILVSFTNEKNIVESDQKLLDLVSEFRVPIILTITNQAKGFLFEFMLASDICFAANYAVFECSTKDLLKNQVGSKYLNKIDSLENQFDAKNALGLGIINQIFDSDNLDEEVLKIAETISGLAPIAVQSCIEAVNKGLEMDLEDGLKLETELFCQIIATEDMKEGTTAFFEKRTPQFIGK